MNSNVQLNVSRYVRCWIVISKWDSNVSTEKMKKGGSNVNGTVRTIPYGAVPHGTLPWKKWKGRGE